MEHTLSKFGGDPCHVQHHKGENLFCFLFSDPVIVGLKCLIFSNCTNAGTLVHDPCHGIVQHVPGV